MLFKKTQKMKKIVLSTLVMLLAASSYAQKLPRTSPLAEVEQIIGLTEIEVKYSRPAVKGRKIFGDVVPFDELWRTGANERAIIEFEDAIKIAGNDIKPGKYSILTIPGKEQWEILFSSNITSWGTNDYDEKDNVLSIKVQPELANFTENLLFYFDEIAWDKGNLIIKWERTKVSIPIQVDVDTKAWAEIQTALKNSPEDATILRNAARYCSDSKTRLDEGLAFIQKSNSIKESWFNLLIEARILAAMGESGKAKEVAQKAIQLGEETSKDGTFNYKSLIEAEMADWK